MKSAWYFLMFAALLSVSTSDSMAEVKLIAKIKVPGTASDKSGLKEQLEDGTTAAQLGGWSAICQATAENEYWLLPDRGPKDGAVSFPTRVHRVRIKIDMQSNTKLSFELLDTLLLRNRQGESLVGRSAAFSGTDASKNLRFDPEGIRQLTGGKIVISDEYGPSIVAFDSASGKADSWFHIPEQYLPKFVSGDPDQEAMENQVGRQANGGFEGLALQPDTQKVLAFAQKPLIQDSELNEKDRRVGAYCRIAEFSSDGNCTGEFLYPVESPATGISEIVALGENRALVLERDGEPGEKAKIKGVFWINIQGASDSRTITSAIPTKLGTNIKPVEKRLFLNFLDPKFGLVGNSFPEKPEGLVLGPKLPDGSQTLLVCIDNDFESAQDSEIWVFAFAASDLP
jgi:hypothetical protein